MCTAGQPHLPGLKRLRPWDLSDCGNSQPARGGGLRSPEAGLTLNGRCSDGCRSGLGMHSVRLPKEGPVRLLDVPGAT